MVIEINIDKEDERFEKIDALLRRHLDPTETIEDGDMSHWWTREIYSREMIREIIRENKEYYGREDHDLDFLISAEYTTMHCWKWEEPDADWWKLHVEAELVPEWLFPDGSEYREVTES